MRKMIMLCLGLILGLAFVLGGCAGNLPKSERAHFLDANYGRSVESVRFNQTVDPEAGFKPEILEGFDGRASKITVDEHRQTFEREAPVDRVSPIFTIDPGN